MEKILDFGGVFAGFEVSSRFFFRFCLGAFLYEVAIPFLALSLYLLFVFYSPRR